MKPNQNLLRGSFPSLECLLSSRALNIECTESTCTKHMPLQPSFPRSAKIVSRSSDTYLMTSKCLLPSVMTIHKCPELSELTC